MVTDVEVAGELVTDLTGVDMEQFQSMLDDSGRKVYKFHYDVEVVPGDKQGHIAFRTKAGGKILGRTELRFDK
jgi:hypothetical protein